jgi:hypothetical protein
MSVMLVIKRDVADLLQERARLADENRALRELRDVMRGFMRDAVRHGKFRNVNRLNRELTEAGLWRDRV